MGEYRSTLDPLTILIEWENAQDVDTFWVKRAMVALQSELERTRELCPVKPRILYLFDQGAVEARQIEAFMAAHAPRIPQLAAVEFVPTPGLTYYKLKNFGARMATTGFIVMLDSDAGPEPGWLEALMAPFADPDVMAVAGFTTLGHKDLVSRMMALCWIFDLPSERARTVERRAIHANNCAFRTAFFQANPWPDLGAFKKQCGFWKRDMERRKIKWVRTADAMTIHAPQPGGFFLMWRAWIEGRDRDFQGAHVSSSGRLARLGYAGKFWRKRVARSTDRILRKGHEVDLPAWQRPAALALAYGYHTIGLVSETWYALTASYPSAEEFRRTHQVSG
jgi:glycosyl transferase family 2